MVKIGSNILELSEFISIVNGKSKINADAKSIKNIQENYAFLNSFSKNKLIYGINTGFGPMAQFKIAEKNQLELQYNLIRSHSSGCGNLMSVKFTRSVMVSRLNSLILGYSGVNTETIKILIDLLNKDVSPCIYEHGGVGASGDLVQLAHLALVLIGEGEVIYKNKKYSTSVIFKKLRINPIKIKIREGIALINGTSAMTGIGLINLSMAKHLLEWSLLLSSMLNEVVEAYDDHISFELNNVKKHSGQNKVAAEIRLILKGSKLIRNRSEYLYNPKNISKNIFQDKVQEYYSIRCITQILGPIYDTINSAEQVLINELNSVNDNPIIDHHNMNIYHGGNFHGDYVSLEMDKLKIAITKLSMLSERQLNYLLNDKLNQKFPPFVNLGKLGLNFGMQGMQFPATSTVAENQTLSFPMYVHSIPNNNDNQDIVSMGCNAAMLTNKVIENTFEVISIQLMTLLQVVDYMKCSKKLSLTTGKLYKSAREVFPVFKSDLPKYQDLENIKNFIKQKNINNL